MTIKEVARMAYQISLGHYINDVKWKSSSDFCKALSHWLPESGDSYIAQMCLPDGRWYVEFTRIQIGNETFYDLYIPDDREHELILINKLYRNITM